MGRRLVFVVRDPAEIVVLKDGTVEAEGTHDKQGLDELGREHDNLRAALDHLQSVDAHRALRLAGALGWFWHLRSHFSEGRTRLAQALAAVDARDETRARALAAGEIAAWAGDLEAARPLIEEAVALWRVRGQTQEIACALIERDRRGRHRAVRDEGHD